MSNEPWYIRKASDTLHVECFTGDDPHLTVNREHGGLVRIELNEVKALCDALASGAGQVAIRTKKRHSHK